MLADLAAARLHTHTAKCSGGRRMQRPQPPPETGAQGAEPRGAGCYARGAVLDRPVILFINHLLAEEQWARDRLVPFAGKRVRVTAPALPDLDFAVASDGMLEAVADGDPDLTIALTPAALPKLLTRDETVLQTIAFSGDAELAGALQFLFRNLRWEYEEDLSRVVGDVAAHRIATTGRAFAAWQKDAAERLGQNVAEYLTEEAELLAPKPELERFSREVADLVDAVERLEKRLDRIARALDARRPG
jgi:ubiquinone biosynthesis protein UbiJ